MKSIIICPQNLEKIQKYACAMDRSLRERVEFLPTASEADLLILFDQYSPRDTIINDTGISGSNTFDSTACNASVCMAKIIVACGERIEGDLRCGLGADCNLTFSSLQKGRLQICLLHSVKCLDGHLCEPFEFSFRGSVGNAYPLLAAASVKILCEVRESS